MLIVSIGDNLHEMSNNVFWEIIASTAHEARRERSELYHREYDQRKVTYNDLYFQQKSL